MNAIQTFILRCEFFRTAVADAVRELPQAPEAADWQRMTSAIVKAWETSTPLENVRDVRAAITGDASGTAVSAVVDALEKLPGCAATGGDVFHDADADLKRAIVHMRTFPVAASSPPKATKGTRRRKARKQDTDLKVMAAMGFKMNNPHWSETECADAADIPGSTLHGRDDWQDWCQKVDRAQATGKTASLKAEHDRRTGTLIPVDSE